MFFEVHEHKTKNIYPKLTHLTLSQAFLFERSPVCNLGVTRDFWLNTAVSAPQ